MLSHVLHGLLRWLRLHRSLVRQVAIGLAGLLLLVVVAQLLYPAGRLLPGVEVANQRVGGQTAMTASQNLNRRYDQATITVKTANKTFTKRLDETGIDVDTWNTARAAAHYSFGQRLIPFSSLAIMLHRDTPMQTRIDSERLKYFGQQVEKEGFVAAVNASIAVKGEEVRLVPAKPSQAYPLSQVLTALKNAAFMPKTEVHLKPEIKQAPRTDEEVKGVLSEAQKAVDTPLTLTLADDKIKVDKTTIGSWLDFPEEPQAQSLRLDFKQDAIKKYLDSIQGKVYKAPGTVRVQLIDGREVSRTAGQPGRGIDSGKAIPALADAVKKGEEATVTVPIAPQAVLTP
jgi:hypothetical protein